MIRSKEANQPVWRDITALSDLPQSLQQLEELANNLWWVWNAPARHLFRELDPLVWYHSKGNPVHVLHTLSQSRIEELTKDKDFLGRLAKVYDSFRAYMDQPMRDDLPSVAYFCMEYGITNILKIYSGGLGILAGDYIKEASDFGANMVGVGFLYRYGYFDQKITADGQQVAEYKAQDFEDLPLTLVRDDNGAPLMLRVPFNGYEVSAQVWRVDVGRVKLYLMDTDIAENSEWDRQITHQLYGGDWENRMKQEYMLGIGGVQMLRLLGIETDVYHANEGHAAFMGLERMAHLVEGGLDFDQALELVRSSSLYTCHTPVPAGHDYFDEALFTKYMGHYADKLHISHQELVDLGRETPGSHEKFSMSVLALNTCQEANGVSKLHGQVSREMFAPVWKSYLPEELHVGYVTNGVHLPTWMASPWADLMEKSVGEGILRDQDSLELWDKVWQTPDKDVWQRRLELKSRLIDYLRRRYEAHMGDFNQDPTMLMSFLETLTPKTLLIGFGRRFATYKRAHLLFTDLERLSKIVNDPEHPVIFIFTGKAHPADGGGQGLIRHIFQISKRPEFLGKILFVDNYDIRVSQFLIPGVDIWLNTPTRPLEASGTSGMKALMNGVLNFSVLDGWWYEGYVKGGGWSLTEKITFSDTNLQDKLDAATIYRMLEEEIIPLYYDNDKEQSYSEGWIHAIKTATSQILPRFTMRRMIRNYYDRFYNQLGERSAMLRANDYRQLGQLLDWERHVAQSWSHLEVVDTRLSKDDGTQLSNFTVGGTARVSVTVDQHDLRSDLAVELIIAREDTKTKKLHLAGKQAFHLVSEEGSRRRYELKVDIDLPGTYKVATRITPTHELLAHPMALGYMKWVPLF